MNFYARLAPAARPRRPQRGGPQCGTQRALTTQFLPKHDIKTRFKCLVKTPPSDANGGDRSSEDRLRDIIQAYNYLKSAGFC